MTMRFINSVVLVLVGAVVGAIGTVAHQSSLTLGAVRMPSGLVIALVTVALLVVGIRLVASGRWAAVWFSLGVIGMIALFSLRSPGGSVLIPNDLSGQIWVFAPAVVCVLAVAWPRVTLRRTPQRPTAGA